MDSTDTEQNVCVLVMTTDSSSMYSAWQPYSVLSSAIIYTIKMNAFNMPYPSCSTTPSGTWRARFCASQTQMNCPVRNKNTHTHQPPSLLQTCKWQQVMNRTRLTTVNSLPADLRKALVHLTFLGLRFFLKFLWHFDLQNLNTLNKRKTKVKSLQSKTAHTFWISTDVLAGSTATDQMTLQKHQSVLSLLELLKQLSPTHKHF